MRLCDNLCDKRFTMLLCAIYYTVVRVMKIEIVRSFHCFNLFNILKIDWKWNNEIIKAIFFI